ncbi:MAG TPA: glycosyltransferase family 87 protein [Dehalococcoidia bacterium]|nr:glycosyltransferase family 87 protein [Dehalococcoidia bacterium]
MTSSLEVPSASPSWLANARHNYQRPALLVVQAAVIVASLIALWYWLPDTFDSWNNERASDFPNFNGSALLVREGFGDRIYDRTPARDEELLEFCNIPDELADASLTFTGPNDACRALDGNFRSPPSIIFLYLPGSFLPGDGAYHAAFIVIALATVALATWTAAYFDSWPARLAVFLAVLALPITQLALRLSQPAALYGLAMLAGFTFHARRMPVPAALCFSFLSLKPQFLVLPLLYLLYRRSWRTALWTACLSIAGFLAGAALVGPTATWNLVELTYDLTIDGPHPLQQAWMYNWQGFALALAGEPLRTAATLLSISSLMLVAVACVRRPAASAALVIAASVLVVPYVLFYDWLILCGAAAIAMAYFSATEGRNWLGVLFLFVWVGVWATHESLPLFGSQAGDLPESEVYWSTVSLVIAMVGYAILSEVLGRTADRPGARREATGPLA